MSKTDKRKKERRIEERRKENRGIVDRRGMDRRFEEKQEDKLFDDQVEGRNAVLELLESDKDINKIYITKGEKHGSINKIIAIAKDRKIIIVEKEKKQMDQISQNENYQGVIAIVPPYKYYDIHKAIGILRDKFCADNMTLSEVTLNRLLGKTVTPQIHTSQDLKELYKGEILWAS